MITTVKTSYRTLLDIRDDIVLRKILEVFPEDQRLEMKNIIRSKIQQANSEWEHEAIAVVVPDTTRSEFFRTIDRNLSPSN